MSPQTSCAGSESPRAALRAGDCVAADDPLVETQGEEVYQDPAAGEIVPGPFVGRQLERQGNLVFAA